MPINTEFPDFPPLDFKPATFGLVVDTSWHNDACPSFETDDRLFRLWVSEPDPADRVMREMPRFHFVAQNKDGDRVRDVFDTENLSDLIGFLRNSFPGIRARGAEGLAPAVPGTVAACVSLRWSELPTEILTMDKDSNVGQDTVRFLADVDALLANHEIESNDAEKIIEAAMNTVRVWYFG
ncbi:MAG: hypothetical protein OEL20_05100 [Sulfuritalea sp.]|nr:hypothetical protein [Sulfuritalea sp.]